MKIIYPSCCKQIMRQLCCFMFVFVLFGLFALTTKAQITSTIPASRCGVGSVVLQAAGSGTIKWYDVPFYGTPVGTGSTFTTPALSVTKTYYVDALDGSGCSLNKTGDTYTGRVPVIATISANSIQANIFYESPTFCNSVSTPQIPTRTGTAGGTYTATGGLKINSVTGAFTPSENSNGTYAITYTVVAAEGCTENPASTQITITTAPVAPSISYSGSPYCTSTIGTISVSQTGATGGSYSASPSGLTINPSTGAITPSTSLSGAYTIAYFVPGAGGCAPQTATTSVTITTLPSAIISYSGSPFCKDNAISQVPTMTGIGAYTGGTFSATGLTIDSSTGAFTPGNNTPGTYTIYYSIPASGNCATVNTSASITINPLPTASISGDATVCQNETSPKITFTGLTGTAPFTFTYKVNNGGNKYVTTSAGSSVDVSQGTLSAGSYVYTLTAVTDANGCSQSASGTATIIITGAPVADFSYPNTVYCSSGTASPTFINGGTAGTFSSTSGLVFVSGQPGVIDITNSLSGTYPITNTISGCGTVSVTTEITISHINPIISGGEVASCGSTTLSASSDASNATFVWLKNNAIIDNQTTSSLIVTESGNYSVKVTNVDTGCEETSAAKTVTINPAPTCSIVATSSDPVKYGSTMSYSAPDGMSSYAWTITGNGTISGDTNANTVTVKATAAGTFTLSLTIKNSNNCTSTCEKTVYVEKVALTAASTVASKTYDGTATAGTVTVGNVSGLLAGEDLAITASASDYADANAGTGKLTTITYTLADGSGLASNYSMASISSTGNITAKQITITPDDNQSKTYGEVDPPLTYTHTALIGTDDVTGALGRFAGETAGLWSYAKGTLTAGTNYTLIIADKQFVIKKVQLTIANPTLTTTKTYDGTASATVTAGTLQNVVSNDDITVSATASYDNANVGSGKTITVIYTLSGSKAVNYDEPAKYTTTGQITALQLTVSDPSVTTSKVYDGSASATVTAGTLQNVIIGENVTVSATASYDNANVGSGKTITVTYTIGGTDNGNYTAPVNYTTTGQINPTAPTAATHALSANQIVWNWNAATGATGYKWCATNDYNSAIDLGNVLTTTQTGLNCNTAYTTYVWAYNGTCVSSATILTGTTSTCSSGDAIYDALSTSRVSYAAASANDLVKITAMEYDAVKTALSATIIGYTGAIADYWETSCVAGDYTFSYNSNTNINTVNSFSANNYPVAFSYVPSMTAGTYSCQLKYNNVGSVTNITNVYSGTTNSNADRQYFVIKTPSQLPNASPYISLYTTSGIGTITTGNKTDISYWSAATGNVTGTPIFNEATGNFNQIPGLQVLQTATKQW